MGDPYANTLKMEVFLQIGLGARSLHVGILLPPFGSRHLAAHTCITIPLPHTFNSEKQYGLPMAVAQVLSQSLAQNLGIQWEPSSRKPSMYTDLLTFMCHSVCIMHVRSKKKYFSFLSHNSLPVVYLLPLNK